MIKRDDIVWLSGLLEGEAWFGFNKGKYPRIGLEMTDEDIVTRVARIWKVSIRRRRNMYRIQLCGINAIEWMMTLIPLLGKCRRNKVVKIIEFWKEHSYSHIKVL